MRGGRGQDTHNREGRGSRREVGRKRNKKLTGDIKGRENRRQRDERKRRKDRDDKDI